MANQRKITRDFSFELEAERDIKMSQVLQGLLKEVGTAARAVNPFGNGRFTVTTKTLQAAETLLNKGVLEVAGREYPLIPLACTTVLVTLHFLPVEVPNDDVRDAFAVYGKVISVKRDFFREAPGVEKGSRRVVIQPKAEIPNYVDIDGFQAMCIYSGMKKSCRRCGMKGHMSFNCKTEQCRRCGEFGHSSTGCEVACKRCGGDHPYTTCTVSTYASVTSPANGTDDQRDDALEEVLSGNSSEDTMEAVDLSKGSSENPAETAQGESSLAQSNMENDASGVTAQGESSSAPSSTETDCPHHKVVSPVTSEEAPQSEEHGELQKTVMQGEVPLQAVSSLQPPGQDDGGTEAPPTSAMVPDQGAESKVQEAGVKRPMSSDADSQGSSPGNPGGMHRLPALLNVEYVQPQGRGGSRIVKKKKDSP